MSSMQESLVMHSLEHNRDNACQDFVIVGERRCGTTSTHKWMSCHPEICLYPRPDWGFFIEDDLDQTDDAEWERSHSREDYAKCFETRKQYAARGHKCADLLFWRPAHARLARFLPEGKFVIILRDPVKRAWSHYWNEVGKGRESLSFTKALAAEDRRSRESAYARFHLSYQARGFYDQSLSAFFEIISPDRVLIVTVEQSKLYPRETLSDIYRFIGVEPGLGFELAGSSTNENFTTVPRPWATVPIVRDVEKIHSRISEAIIVRSTSDPYARRKLRKSLQTVFRKPAAHIKMPEKVRLSLSKIYKPHIAALESLLNRQFPEWRQASR